MILQELIGWGSALLLLPTFGIQAFRQWESRHEPTSGESLWFFILAFAGTGGQVVYSWMVGNRVYFALNAILVITNGIGLAVAIHRWRIRRDRRPDAGSSQDRPPEQPTGATRH